MSQIYEGVRWTTTDLELLPDNSNDELISPLLPEFNCVVGSLFI
jgi:hypothetical protein